MNFVRYKRHRQSAVCFNKRFVFGKNRRKLGKFFGTFLLDGAVNDNQFFPLCEAAVRKRDFPERVSVAAQCFRVRFLRDSEVSKRVFFCRSTLYARKKRFYELVAGRIVVLP